MTNNEKPMSAEQLRAIQHAIVRLRASVMSLVFALAGGTLSISGYDLVGPSRTGTGTDKSRSHATTAS